MNNLSLVTYTHTKAKDLHPAYFGRLAKYFPQMKNVYVSCNEEISYATTVLYNDFTRHANQMMDVLDATPSKYVIYCQEDYILYDYVNVDKLNEFMEIMDADDIPFIRLIESGVGTVSRVYNDELSYVGTDSPYYFSTQATIWNKDVLYNMFKTSNVQSIFQEPDNTPYLLSITNRGLFTSKRGAAVGGHYNSLYYPYIATAVVKGKWNMREYSNELSEIFNEFGLTPSNRGIF